jgi:hypothetical protein
MQTDELIRRDVLHGLAVLPLIGLLAQAGEAAAQPAGTPVKVDTKGLVAKIKFEAPLAGFLTDLNEKYKLRVTELTLAPGGHVGEHNHVGPGIRQVTSGCRDPPSLKWSDLRYGFWHQGGPIWRGGDTSPKRSSPS